MAEWSAKTDIYKMGIAQAYAQNNINLAAQIAEDAAEIQHQHEIDIAEMTLEANNKAAKAKGAGSVIGSVIGGVATVAAATL